MRRKEEVKERAGNEIGIYACMKDEGA